MATICTLTRYPDIFAPFSESVYRFEPFARRIVVTSGNAEWPAAPWEHIKGTEPFIFARNANLAIGASLRGSEHQHVLLCNDDVRLLSPVLRQMAAAMSRHPRIGILSPQIEGGAGNPLLTSPAVRELTISEERLPFICVLLRNQMLREVGLLDERFTGYGGDDVDYCRRAQAAGWQLAVTPLVRVKHGHEGEKQPYSTSYLRQMTNSQRNASMAEMDALVKEKHGD